MSTVSIGIAHGECKAKQEHLWTWVHTDTLKSLLVSRELISATLTLKEGSRGTSDGCNTVALG